jgi:hypothetical protein
MPMSSGKAKLGTAKADEAAERSDSHTAGKGADAGLARGRFGSD